ncbi:MAG: cobalamin biosynthesis protein [Pseudorhodobacter sp.]
MKVAGFGLRASATAQDLARLFDAARVDALAIPADKADHPAIRALAADCGLPLIPVAPERLAAQPTATLSPRQPPRYGTGSVAEAAALAAAGPGARLVLPRQVAASGRATMAIAEGTTT